MKFIKLLSLLIVLLCFFTILFNYFNSNKTNEANIVFTTSLQGEMEPCGCSLDQKGGISKIASLISDTKKSSNTKTLFLDSGNLIFNSNNNICESKQKAPFLLEAFVSMGIDLVFKICDGLRSFQY